MRGDSQGSNVLAVLCCASESGEISLSAAPGLVEALEDACLAVGSELKQKVLLALIEAAEIEDERVRQSLGQIVEQLPGVGVFVTLTVQDFLRTRIQDNCRFVELGIITPTGADRGERIYALAHPDLPEPQPLERNYYSGNIPNPQRSFLGREQEVARLENLLAEKRLITITGAPGVGKSVLAQRVARASYEDFSGGIWWFDLRSCSSPEDLYAQFSMEKALVGLRKPDTAEAFASCICSKQILLVLDGCERLRKDIAPLVRAVLVGAPSVTVLITSSVPLGLPGEALLPLMGMSLGRLDMAADELAILEADALHLFFDRAAEYGTLLSFDEDVIEAALSLCRSVDGIPLCIEVLAASLRHSKLKTLVKKVGISKSSTFSLSEAGERLRSALDAAYGLLSTDSQRCAVRLSMLRNGWDLETAANFLTYGEGEVAALHRTLLEQSWIVTEDEAELYRFLNPIRDYLASKASDADYQSFIQTIIPVLERCSASMYAEDEGAKQLLRRHYRDFLAAVDICLERKELKHFIPLLIQKLVPIWSRRNLLEDASRAIDKTIKQLKGLDRGRALTMLGILAARKNRLGEAEARLLSAWEIGKSESLPLVAAGALSNLGFVLCQDGRVREALEYYEQAIEVWKSLGDQGRLALLYVNAADAALGYAEKMEGDERLVYCRRATGYLDLLEEMEVSDPAVRQAKMHNSAHCALLGGDLKTADYHFRRSIAECLAGDLLHETFEGVVGLARVAMARGDHDVAAKLLGLSRRILDDSGHGGSSIDVETVGSMSKELRSLLGATRLESLLKYGSRMDIRDLAHTAVFI